VRPESVAVAPDGAARLIDLGLAVVAGAAGLSGPAGDVRGLAVLAGQLLASSPGVPPPPVVDAVIRRALAGAGVPPWHTCGELVGALDAALAGRSVPEAGPAPRTRNRALPWIAAAAAALLVLTAIVAVAQHALQPGPALRLSPASAHTGDVVTVSGSALPPGQVGTVVLAGRPAPAAAFTADGGGSFSVRITVPQDAAGDTRVQACWGGYCPLSQVLHVLGSPSPPPTAAPAPPVVLTPTPTVTPSISVDRLTARRGDTIRVTGRGFDPLRRYTVVLGEGGRRWTLQPPASPDATGAFEDAVQVPRDARRGTATVMACVSPQGAVPTCAYQALMIA
jgi:hypothetical protein